MRMQEAAWDMAAAEEVFLKRAREALPLRDRWKAARQAHEGSLNILHSFIQTRFCRQFGPISVKDWKKTWLPFLKALHDAHLKERAAKEAVEREVVKFCEAREKEEKSRQIKESLEARFAELARRFVSEYCKEKLRGASGGLLVLDDLKEGKKGKK